jgi:hypothetical protein
MKNKSIENKEFSKAEKISRKKAIKMAGFYTITTASMILLLGTQKSAAVSLPPSPPIW